MAYLFYGLLDYQQGRHMLKKAAGFSLIELMVSLAVFAVLITLAVPSYSEWIRNSRIRTTADSIQNGLQIAKAEAVRQNTTARFQFTDTLDSACALTTSGPNWIVSIDDVAGKCDVAPSEITAPRIVRVRSGAEGSSANTTIASGQESFVFNGMGRLVPAATVSINVTDTTGTSRSLRVSVSAGGQIRMCDPALPSTDIQSC